MALLLDKLLTLSCSHFFMWLGGKAKLCILVFPSWMLDQVSELTYKKHPASLLLYIAYETQLRKLKTGRMTSDLSLEVPLCVQTKTYISDTSYKFHKDNAVLINVMHIGPGLCTAM